MAIGDKKPVLMKSDIGAAGGVAPAGYGYGEKVVAINVTGDADGTLFDSKLDELLETLADGWAQQISFEDYPYLSGVAFYGTLFRHTKDYSVLVGVSYGVKESIVIKRKFDGVWEPFEWQNPPTETGKEYRTTERYNGKPVYCRAVPYGDVSANIVFAINYASDATKTGRFLRGSVSGYRDGGTSVTANQTGTYYSGCVFSCDGLNYEEHEGYFVIRQYCKCTEALTDVVGVAYYTKE